MVPIVCISLELTAAVLFLSPAFIHSSFPINIFDRHSWRSRDNSRDASSLHLPASATQGCGTFLSVELREMNQSTAHGEQRTQHDTSTCDGLYHRPPLTRSRIRSVTCTVTRSPSRGQAFVINSADCRCPTSGRSLPIVPPLDPFLCPGSHSAKPLAYQHACQLSISQSANLSNLPQECGLYPWHSHPTW